MTEDKYNIIYEGLKEGNEFYYKLFTQMSLQEKREYVDIACTEHVKSDVNLHPIVMPVNMSIASRTSVNLTICIRSIWVAVCTLSKINKAVRSLHHMHMLAIRNRLIRPNNTLKRKIPRTINPNGISLITIRRMRHKTKLARILNRYVHQIDRDETQQARLKQIKRLLYKLL